MVLSDRYQNPASDKSPEYNLANNHTEGMSPDFKGILRSPDDGSHQLTFHEDFPRFTMGQSNNPPRNSNINNHIEESKITQNVNIYVDTRNPNNNSSQTSNNHNSCDPENPEIQTSKNKPILLSKTNLPRLAGMSQGTSINVLQRSANTPDNPPRVSV